MMPAVKRPPWTLGYTRENDITIILLSKGFVSTVDMDDKDLENL